MNNKTKDNRCSWGVLTNRNNEIKELEQKCNTLSEFIQYNYNKKIDIEFSPGNDEISILSKHEKYLLDKTQQKIKPVKDNIIITIEEEEEDDDEIKAFLLADAEANRIRQIERDAKLHEIRAKKIQKDNIIPLRVELCAGINAEIAKLQMLLDEKIQYGKDIIAGKHDKDIINEVPIMLKTHETIKAIQIVEESVDVTKRKRKSKPRPKCGNIHVLFSKDTLIRCKMGDQDYFANVNINNKMLQYRSNENGGNDMKGVKSYLTKTIKLPGGRSLDEADKSEPEKTRIEWKSKDDWIKSCKGEQNLYSSSKNGWLEISYKSDCGEWINLHDIAYDGIKLN